MRPSSSLHNDCCTYHQISCHNVYIISSCFFGGVRMSEEVRYALRLSKASLASSIHLNLPVFFSNLKKGNPFSPSHDMKRLRAAMQPVNFCTSLTHRGGPISVIAWIRLVLALIPRWLTKNLSSCPDGTPNTHLFGFNFHFHFFRFSKVCFKSSISVSGFFVFTTMSSTYTSAFSPICSPRHVWIAL
jgi:hypothetical protein